MIVPVASAQRSGAWLAGPGFGVYVHIPFCRHRCHYCDFNTYEGLDALHAPYVDALIADIEHTSGDLPEATSVFFGGGTPTLLPVGDLARIIDAVRARVGIAPDAEVTVEANPETVDEAYFEALLGAGLNRVSIGIQSLVPHVLEGLGRTHSFETALRAISAARSVGVQDVNADLIYGSVWETPGDWMRSLEGVVDAAPDHISAYALTIEEGTPLDTLVRTGRVPDVDPDVQAERHAIADEVLSAAGYHRYEVSNWAKPGRASRHNVLYWSAGEYLAFGAGAHGHLGGRRYWNTRLPRDFVDAIASGASTESGHEIVEDGQAEALMLGLRLSSGIRVSDFEDRFGSLAERRPLIEALLTEGSLAEDDGWLHIPADRTMVANDIIARLI